jgi:hypothetical protein
MSVAACDANEQDMGTVAGCNKDRGANDSIDLMPQAFTLSATEASHV